MNRTMMYSIIGIALLATTGIGYAAFTSTIGINATGTAGSLNLFWSATGWSAQSYTEAGGSAPYVSCAVSGQGTNTLTVNVGDLAPGDYCVIRGYIQNGGNIPGTVTGTLFNPTVINCYCFLEDDTFHHEAVSGTGNGAGGSELNGTASTTSGLPPVGQSMGSVNIPIGANNAVIPFVMVWQLNDNAVNSAQGQSDSLQLQYTVSAGA